MLLHQKIDILPMSGCKVNFSFYPGVTIEDITDHLRLAMGKKSDAIIIHAGAIDITNDANTMQYEKVLQRF